MYGFIWRHLPGPAWVKFLEALALLLLVVFALFQFVFPWVLETFPIFDNTVGE